MVLPMLLGTINIPSASAFTANFPHYLVTRSPESIISTTSLNYIQEPTDKRASNRDFLNSNNARQNNNSPKAAAFQTNASENADPKTAVDELLEGINDETEVIFLFVGQYHAESFQEIVTYSQGKVQPSVEVVTVLGGGVIGGGSELDQTDTPAISMLSGSLPSGSSAMLFQYEEGVDESISKLVPGAKEDLERPPSYMVFSDPFAPLHELLTHLEQPNSNLPPPVVAGGVSVPPKQGHVPSIARNGQVLPAGSLVGVEFTGTVGLQAVVAQGCRPVGPTFVITHASNTVLTGLSGESAISRLEEVAADAEKKDQELIRNGELVCGLGSSDSVVLEENFGTDGDDDDDESEGTVRTEDDFLIRQIMGFQPKSGSIVVAAGGLKEGTSFRFHVRAAKSAREDMELMIQRAKTERLFAGSSSLLTKGPGAPCATAGKPLAAFQFSCVARGSSFFGAPDVDLKNVEELFDGQGDSPVAGFFANGEIGPVGIRTAEMAEQSDKTTGNTFLHGFTTVVAMLCDYSEASTSAKTDEVSASAVIVTDADDAWA